MSRNGTKGKGPRVAGAAAAVLDAPKFLPLKNPRFPREVCDADTDVDAVEAATPESLLGSHGLVRDMSLSVVCAPVCLFGWLFVRNPDTLSNSYIATFTDVAVGHFATPHYSH